jgi:thioredoxin 1
MPRSLTEQTFHEALIGTPGLMMVDFWADRCGPSQAIAPVLDELASQGRVTLMTVNVDENPELATRYSIGSIPTILFVKHGKVVDRIVGAASKALLQAIVTARA